MISVEKTMDALKSENFAFVDRTRGELLELPDRLSDRERLDELMWVYQNVPEAREKIKGRIENYLKMFETRQKVVKVEELCIIGALCDVPSINKKFNKLFWEKANELIRVCGIDFEEDCDLIIDGRQFDDDWTPEEILDFDITNTLDNYRDLGHEYLVYRLCLVFNISVTEQEIRKCLFRFGSADLLPYEVEYYSKKYE